MEEQPEKTVLIVNPEITYQRLSSKLTALGWEESNPISILPPIIPGEPETSLWKFGDGSACLTYEFNPVVYLRCLTLTHVSPGALSAIDSVVETMGADVIYSLFSSQEPKQLIYALLASARTHMVSAIPEVGRLCRHENKTVARIAVQTLKQLSKTAARQGTEYIRKHGDNPTFIYDHLPDTYSKCQALRWLGTTADKTNLNALKALSSGLEDPDWEVRVTAMLVAIRLGASSLAKAVQRTNLPDTGGCGLDRDERRLLDFLRKIGVALLTGKVTAETIKHVPVGKKGPDPEFLKHLCNVLQNREILQHDRAFLFINAFLLPVDHFVSVPEDLPSCVREKKGRFYLKHSGIELALIPPGDYWLGDGIKQPVRRIALSSHLFIMRNPEDAGDPCTFREAISRCQAFSEKEGNVVRLPTPDEWEMAVRSTDGRLYPWGNGFIKSAGDTYLDTAWGLHIRQFPEGEWTSESGAPYIKHGKKPLRCSEIKPGDEVEDRCCVRAIISV